jgi:hypothetical protein
MIQIFLSIVNTKSLMASLFLFCRCVVPDVDKNGTMSWSSSDVLASIPHTEDGILDSCHVIDPTTNSSVKCSQWVYDNTYYHSSRAIEVHEKHHWDVWFLLPFVSYSFLLGSGVLTFHAPCTNCLKCVHNEETLSLYPAICFISNIMKHIASWIRCWLNFILICPF